MGSRSLRLAPPDGFAREREGELGFRLATVARRKREEGSGARRKKEGERGEG